MLTRAAALVLLVAPLVCGFPATSAGLPWRKEGAAAQNSAFPASELAQQLHLRTSLRLDTFGACASILSPYREDLNQQSLGRVLSVLKKKRSSEGAVAVVAYALESCPLVLNTQHWTMALKACRRASAWRASLELLETMHETGHMPDLECYSCAAATCAACGQYDRSVDLLRLTVAKAMMPEPSSCAPVIAALGRAGRGEEALALFSELGDAGVTHDATSYSSLVEALQLSDLPEGALGAFRAMKREGFDPDQAAYRAALAAARRADEIQLANDLLAEGVVRWHWAPAPEWEQYSGWKVRPALPLGVDRGGQHDERQEAQGR